jgi:hypothetical protein
MNPNRETCILIAFHAILNDTEEYQRKAGMTCPESTADYAVEYGTAMWNRLKAERPTIDQIMKTTFY